MKFIEALAAILNAVAALVNNGESFSQKHFACQPNYYTVFIKSLIMIGAC
jgi:hypothetical protein